MVCTAGGWVDRCMPAGFAMDMCPQWRGLHAPFFLAAWAAQQKHICHDPSAQWCDGNYWRPCT